MLALLLVLATFLYLTLVGQAVVSLFRARMGVLWSWFVAPTVGLSILIVIATRLNVWGIPVRAFGPWLTAALGLGSAAILAWRRPAFPWRKLLPFLVIVAAFLAYAGWPLTLFGFNWISYGNDDMANYCLAAERFLDHGYYDLPLQTDLEGMDYTQHYWFMHGLQQIRPGSELTIAWLASLTGLKAHQVFMPTILMLSMTQVFAMCALGIVRGRNRRTVLLAALLLATSPLFGLGTLYQLIAQVGGIALLLTVTSMLLVPRILSLRKLGLAGLVTACLAIFYPEVAPFVAFSIIICAIRLRYTDRALMNRYAIFIAGVAVLTFLLIATNTYQFVNTLVMQSVGSAGLGAMAEINDQSGGLVLFPWTLVPSFVPMLFGLHAFGIVGVDPLISFQILVGFCFLGFFFWRVYLNFKEDIPAGYVGLVMCILGIYLFYKGQDFGLFKLAMFAQPIIAIVVAQGFLLLFRHVPVPRLRWVRIGLGFFILCTIPSHVYYSYSSLGNFGGGLTEVVGASRLGVSFKIPKDLKFDAIDSDISNVVTAKMLAQYTRGWDTRFLSRSYMDNIANIAVLKFLRTPDPDLGPQARIIEKLSLLRGLLPKEIMETPEGTVPDYRVMSITKTGVNTWTETSARHLNYKDRLFVSVRTELDHFNKYNPGPGWIVQNMYQYQLESQLRDRLVFIHSDLSPHYYSSARFKAAFFQREGEPIMRDKDYFFHGSGRYNLFQILNPSKDLRVVVDFSTTSLGEGRSKLPDQAVVVGDEDYLLPFVGHGSARVFSPIITPEEFEKQSYITVDFRTEAKPIDKKKTGLMRLYGQVFNLDDRRLVGFVRDISVITDEQYQAMERPTRIGNFPKDLARYPGLEYSGLFEDGWMTDDAYFKLGASHPGQVLYFKGYVPDTPRFRTAGVDATISINGKPTEIVNLKAGEFTLTRLIRESSAITSISFHFSASEKYSGEDPRAFSVHVGEISIEDLPDLTAFRKLTNQKGDKFDLKGIDDDGWLAREAEFSAPVFSDFKVLKVDLEMPGWAPIPRNSLQVSLNGKVEETSDVPQTTYKSLYIPLQPGAVNKVTLAAGQVYPLPNDTRQRSFLLKNISFENLSPTDLYLRGWHRSGYLFKLDRADGDGWVDRSISFEFPATDKFKTALVEVVRFPARADLPLDVAVNGTVTEAMSLELEKTTRIRIPLSSTQATAAMLRSPRNFPLAAPDTRERSFRIVNIDFE